MSRIMSKLSVISEARRKAEDRKRESAKEEDKPEQSATESTVKRVMPSGTRAERVAAEEPRKPVGASIVRRVSSKSSKVETPTLVASIIDLIKTYQKPLTTAVSVVFLIVLLGSVLKPPIYESSARIEFAKDNIQNEWDLLIDETRNVDFEEQVRSRAVLEPVLVNLGWFPPKRKRSNEPKVLTETQKERILNQMLNNFQRGLVVERIRHSGVLRITYYHKSPAVAAEAANLVAASFIDFNRNQAVQKASLHVAAMDQELNTLKNELETIVEERKQFLLANGWDHYESELARVQSRVSDLKTSIRVLEDTVSSLGAAVDTIDPQILETLKKSGGSMSSESSLDDLRKQLADAESRLSQIRGRYLPDNPLVMQAAREKSTLEAALSVQAKERKQALEEQLLYQQLRLRRLMEASPQAKAFEAAIINAETQYQELLDKKAQARLSVSLMNQPSKDFGSLRILDSAVAPERKSGIKRIIKASIGAFLVSVFAFLVMVILLRYLVSSKKSPRSILQQLGKTFSYDPSGTAPTAMQKDPQGVLEFLGKYVAKIRQYQKKG